MAYDGVARAPGSDARAAVLKSVGRAQPEQWLKALARQRYAPQWGRPSLDRLSGQQLAELASSQTGLFVPRGGAAAVSVKAARSPAPKTSFGFVDVFATVDAKVDFLDGFLVLKTGLRSLSHVQLESLRLFRWDPEGRRFTIVPRSAVGPKGAYVFARISQRGLYSIVGLHFLPEVVETVRLICGLSDRARRLPAPESKRLKDRVCEMILCAGDGRGGLPGGQLGMNPCETCTGLSDTEWFNLPECQILAERPCVDGGWTEMGPQQITGSQNRPFKRGIGCAKNVVVDESDHRRVYATGEHGGVWVLSRADRWPQSRWAPIGDALEGLQMRAIAIAPSKPEQLYVGNAFGFIYVSRNRGSSWTRTGDTDLGFIRRILVDRTLQQTLFVATNSGLHRSTDSGGTWTQLLDPGRFPIRDVLDAVMDPDDSTVLYIGVRRQGVFKSSDSGQRWTSVLPFSDALSQANQMIKLSLGLRHPGGTSQSDLDRTVAVKFGQEVLINNDGGRSSFVSKGTLGESGGGGHRRRSDGGQFSGEWCNVLAVDPNNPSLVLAGQEGLFKTTDAGATWRRIMPDQPGDVGRLTHEDFQDVCFDAQMPGVAYLACDGGVYRYVDARVDDPDGDLDAEQFEERNNGLAISEFFRVSVRGSLAIGNLDHNGLKATTDLPSRTWQHVPVGGNALETHSVYADPKRPGRFYTVDIGPGGGSLKRLRFPTAVDSPADLLVFAPFVPYFSNVNSLTEVSQFASLPMSPIAVDVRVGSNVMLACAHRNNTEGFRLMLTYAAHQEPTVDAAGNSTFPAWEVAYDNGRQDPIVSVTFAPSAPGTAYGISAAGRVVSKADVTAGAADEGWDVRGPWPQTDVRQVAVNAQFPERIYAVSGQAFGRSGDGGRHWAITDVTSPQGHELNSLAVHPHDAYTLFVGADTGVFISYDEGAHWAPYDVGLPNAEVTQVQTDGPYLYAVTHGRGLWQRRYC